MRENLRWLPVAKASLIVIVVAGCGSKPSNQQPANNVDANGKNAAPLQTSSDLPSSPTPTHPAVPTSQTSTSGTNTELPTTSSDLDPSWDTPSTASSSSSGNAKNNTETKNESESKQNEAQQKKTDDDFALIQNPKTPDAQALEALNRLLRSGKKPNLLSQAAIQRGRNLLSEPSRAETLFVWAQNTDKKSADASFELAKLSANQGEIPKVKIHLREVARRGGKKLLRTLEYDPTFALVSDDSEVQRLWRD